MPSPFPGMDPYIESSGLWSDFHALFLAVCQEQILTRLPLTYDARVNEQVKLIDVSTAGPWPDEIVVPDVLVARGPRRAPLPPPSPSSVATLEPITARAPDLVRVRETWLEVRTRPGDELVTTVEILSPSNKYSPGFADHQSKRASLVHAGVNVLDVDLLVGGTRLELTPPLPRTDYVVLLFRPTASPFCEAYAWGVRQPLPAVPLPLKAGDPDLALDLAAAFATAYDRRQYPRSLRYDQPLKVRLSEQDLAWAADVATCGSSPG